MTIAVCIYCGEKKFGAWNPCESCGRMPSGMDDQARSVILSDHFMGMESLEKAQRAVKERYPWYEIPQIKASIDSYKRECFTKDGELDVEKIMAYYEDPSHSEGNNQDDDEDSPDTTGVGVLQSDRKPKDAPRFNSEDQCCDYSHAPNAICVFCGADKVEPLAMCSICRRQPKDLDSVTLSIILSTHEVSSDMLVQMQHIIRTGIDWKKASQIQQLLRKYRPNLADENGELNLMKVARYCHSQARGNISEVKSLPIVQHRTTNPPPNPTDQSAIEESDWKPWNRFVNFVFSILSIYFPLGMLIGSIGMVTRRNREQCAALWDDSTHALWLLVFVGALRGIYFTDMWHYFIVTIIACYIFMKLIRYFGLKPKPQQYVSVVLSTVFLLLSFGGILAFCTGALDDPERQEVINYCANYISPAAVHEQNALNRWASLVQQNTPLDDCAPVIEREILPELKKSLQILESLRPQLPALREFHATLLDVSQKRIEAFRELDAGIREHNELRINLSETSMQLVEDGVRKSVSSFKELLREYDINGSFPNLDGAVPAKP